MSTPPILADEDERREILDSLRLLSGIVRQGRDHRRSRAFARAARALELVSQLLGDSAD